MYFAHRWQRWDPKAIPSSLQEKGNQSRRCGKGSVGSQHLPYVESIALFSILQQINQATFQEAHQRVILKNLNMGSRFYGGFTAHLWQVQEAVGGEEGET